MSEPLRFPVGNRERPFDLIEFADMTKETLDGDERRVVRQVGLELVMEYGQLETFGDVLDTLASAGPQGRRELVDRARTALGMPTIGDEQATVRIEAANSALKWAPDAEGRRLTSCSAKGCDRYPTKHGGALRPVADRRWWCPEHAHLRGPEDHLPEPERYVVKASGGLRAVGEEAERIRTEAEKSRAEFEAKQRAREAEGERLAKLEEEHRESLRPPAWMRRTT